MLLTSMSRAKRRDRKVRRKVLPAVDIRCRGPVANSEAAVGRLRAESERPPGATWGTRRSTRSRPATRWNRERTPTPMVLTGRLVPPGLFPSAGQRSSGNGHSRAVDSSRLLSRPSSPPTGPWAVPRCPPWCPHCYCPILLSLALLRSVGGRRSGAPFWANRRPGGHKRFPHPAILMHLPQKRLGGCVEDPARALSEAPSIAEAYMLKHV
jgi:hypothetical protein